MLYNALRLIFITLFVLVFACFLFEIVIGGEKYVGRENQTVCNVNSLCLLQNESMNINIHQPEEFVTVDHPNFIQLKVGNKISFRIYPEKF